jgi:dienelactone hydrolase
MTEPPVKVDGVTENAADPPIELFGADALPDEPGDAMASLPLPVRRDGETVPALLWLPAGASGPRPVVLIGHGSGGHKAAPIVTGLARGLTRIGLAAISIDLPFHGDRTPPDEVGMSAAERRSRMGLQAWRQRNSKANEQAVADWRAALDAAQVLPEVGRTPVGYIGLSLGTRSGLPLVAAEKRIAAAVLGLFGYSGQPGSGDVAQAASQIAIPVLFLVQWDDELFARGDGLALFDLLGSRQKTLHASPGRHRDVPPAELTYAIRFLDEQLSARPRLSVQP